MALAVSSAAGCGEPARDLREWTPADHQPAPEGAGVPDDAVIDSEPGTAGAALFAVHCATCHGPTGHGDGPGAPPVANVPDLTDPELAARRTDADVEALILEGRGFMPGFERTLPIEGIRAITLYVRTLAPLTAVPSPEETPTDAVAPEAAPTEAEAADAVAPEAAPAEAASAEAEPRAPEPAGAPE